MSVRHQRHYSFTVLVGLLVLALSTQGIANETDQDAPVGAVGGAVHADLFTGTATTSIPIEVPPGRQGVQPELSLVYGSANGNGWVGMGWKLEKGVIERQTKFGVDYNGDGYVFRLSGINVELVNIGNDEYRAKIEGGFTRVEKLTATDGKPYFEATDKTGKKFFFGQAANTRVSDPADSNNIFRWCLDRVEDPNGNYMTLTYTADQGQAYLDTISYTGNDSLAPTNTVKFYLEDRPDAPPMYVPNFLMTTAKRLKTIAVQANGSLVRAYKLTYTTSTSTSHSLLSSVQQFGNDAQIDQSNGTISGGMTLPTIVMTFAGGETGYTTFFSGPGWDDSSWGIDPKYYSTIRYPDVNGDGKADVCGRHGGGIQCYLSTGTGFTTVINGPGWDDSSWGIDPKYYSTITYPDVNGDGKADVCGRHGGGIQCYLSTGTGFTTVINGPGWDDSSWGTDPKYYSTITYPDVNGDGKADVCGRHGGGIQCYLSTGTGFTTVINGPGWDDSSWGTDPKYYSTITYPDVNGDGKADVCGRHGGGIQCYLSTGTGFTTVINGPGWDDSSWGIDPKYYSTIRYPDVNGDGKADVCGRHGGGIQCYLSTGTGFTTVINGPGWDDSSWGIDPKYYSTITYPDVNGDGKADVCGRHGGGIQCYLSTGTGFTTVINGPGWDDSSWGTDPKYYSTITYPDVNGDGKADLCGRGGDGIQCYWGGNANGVENLRIISIGLGASTTIEYTPSTEYTNTQLPFPVQTVSKIMTDDGNGHVAETTYEYSEGFHHIAERDFRGFHNVKVTGPAGPSGEQTITETWFHQGNDTAVGENNPNVADGYLKGAPYRTKVTDGAGQLYTDTTTTYTDDNDGQAPFFAPPSQVITSICDGNGCSKQTRTDFTYDIYGNVTQEFQHGEVGDTTDDRTVVRTFNLNTTDWIVSLPTSEAIYQGLGTGSQVAKTDFYYDGTTSCAVASSNQQPTQGNLTRVVRWLNGGTSPETRMAYDALGNVLCTRDANGHTTTMAYDSTGTFATSVTNPLGHITTTQYYGVEGVPMDTGLYGQVKRVTDPNGAVVSTAYDPLGRRTSVIQPDGFSTTTSYVSFGTVGAQHVRTDSSLGLSTWTFFDGLGRTINAKSTGTDSKIIVTDTEYDNRGAVTRTSTPYFETGGSPLWSTVTYDPLGRAIHTVNPDGSRVLSCFDDWVTVTIDANNHKTRSVRDAYGRVVTVQEYLGDVTTCTTAAGSPYATTTYNYDVLGNLLTLVDAKGNVSTMAYDTLSRKTIMHDPDMGTWTYTYDATGNLTTQTDAKSQQLHFQYDSLNRRVQKDYDTIKALGSGDVVYTYDGSTNNRTGRLQRVDDSSGTTTFFYDITGRVTRTDKVVDSTTYTTQSTYDGLGRVTAITYPDASVVTQTYNGPQLQDVKEGSVTYASYGSFNALGQPSTLTLGNGVTTSYTYDSANFRLATLKTVKGSTVLQDLEYTFDAGGNVTALTDAKHGDQTFGYDDLDRLTSATGTYGTISYAYNEIGNLLSNSQVGSYSYPASGSSSVRPHAVTSAGTHTYTYDANGNMETGAGRTITYDHENRPISMTTSGSGTGNTVPSITTQPADVLVTAPAPATFTVTATGTPAPTYQWQRDGVDISGATQASYTLNPTTVADTGAQFRVVVSTTSGSVTSAAATLTVQSASGTAPTVVQHAKTQGIFANTHAVTLTVAPGQRLVAFTGSVRPSSGSTIPAALSVTWNGTEALTEIQNINQGGRARVQAWVLETPTAGTFVLDAQWDSAADQRHLHGVVLDHAGLGLTSVAATTQGNATAITSAAVPSTPGHLLIDFGLYADNEDLTWTPHTGQTQQGAYSRLTLGRKSRAAVSAKPGASSTALGWDATGGGTATNLLHVVLNIPADSSQASLPSDVEASSLMMAAAGPDPENIIRNTRLAGISIDPSRLHTTFSVNQTIVKRLENVSGPSSHFNWQDPGTENWTEASAFSRYLRLAAFRAQATQLASGVDHVAAADDATQRQLDDVLVRTQSTPPPTSLTTTFAYDGDGGRVKKTVDDGSTVTATTYIGQLYVCEGTAPPLSCAKMIFAGSQRIAMVQVDTGAASYFHPDHLGSTSVLTDANGTVEQDVAYYPYGDTRNNTGTADVAYKYTGKEQDGSTGLYFYEARYYDPVLGRFISPDTIVPDPLDPQAFNRYCYVLNNPLKYTDPSGQVPNGLGGGGITINLDNNGSTLSVGGDFSFGDLGSLISGSGTVGSQVGITFDPAVDAVLAGIPRSQRAAFLEVIIKHAPHLYTISSSSSTSSGSSSVAGGGESNAPFVSSDSNGYSPSTSGILGGRIYLASTDSYTRYNQGGSKNDVISSVDLLPLDNPRNLGITLNTSNFSSSTVFGVLVEAGSPIDNFGLPGGASLTDVRFKTIGGEILRPLPNGRNGSLLSFQLDVTQSLGARYFRITPVISSPTNQTYGIPRFLTPRAVHNMGGCRACNLSQPAYDQPLPLLPR